jgi:hypothetical protein
MRKTVLRLHYLRLEAELLEALLAVVEDQSMQKGFSRRRAEEGVMTVFGDVDPDDEMLSRSANLALQLTGLLKSAIIILIHRDLLVKSFDVGTSSNILTGGFFFGSLIIKNFPCYRLGSGLHVGII